MTATSNRNYNCKNEELPVMGKFLSFSLLRDAGDFYNFSPKFDINYINAFNQKIANVDEVIEPKTELAQQAALNTEMHEAMDSLKDPINRLVAYIDLGKSDIKISSDSFGVAELRKGLRIYDTEKVTKSLHTVCVNCNTHREALNKQGFTEELLQKFVNANNKITNDKQTLYQMLVNRRNIIQDNQIMFNDLYEQMNEIMNIGKVLYKTSNPARTLEYTFSELKKRVSGPSKTSTTPEEAKVATK